ncbi:MAG: T9SS type A sorting domain-containing protein, partial [Flavobacteriales bacterium]
GGPFFDDEIIALANEDGDIGQFYSVCQLHENTQDENSQQFIILVNPYDETVTDSTFELSTLNQNLPFDYTLSDGEELRYWEELARPELNLEEELTEDPDHFWLDPQALTELQILCTTDSTEVGTETVIVDIEPIDSCTVFLGEIICVPIGYDTTFAEVPVFEYTEMCDTNYYYAADTLYNIREQIRIQDPYTSLFAVGFVGNQGIWVTREAVNFNTTPDWWRVGDAPGNGGVKSIEFTSDGNHMFVTGWDGSVTRFSGFEDVWSEDDLDNLVETEIYNSSGVTTGLSIDPQNSNHVVVSIGGYGSIASGKVVESFNALADNPSWDNIWVPSNDPISPMPIYDVVIDYTDPEVILVATEHGVYATDNGGDDWEAVNMGMAPAADAIACPVHAIKQQWRGGTNWSYPQNTGVVYAGTHGRGIFRTGTLVGVNEADNGIDQDQDLFAVYPNPNNTGNLSMNLDLDAASDVLVQIYSLQGRLVLSKNLGQMSGQQVVQLDINALANGQYVIRVDAGASSKVSKFVVLK